MNGSRALVRLRFVIAVRQSGGMAWMTDRKAQLVTLRAFLMLAVITVAIATFTAIVSVWPGP